MTKKRVVFCLILFFCFGLNSCITRWLVREDLSGDCGEVAKFSRYEGAFGEFVQSHDLTDGEQLTGEKLPERLHDLGIVSVYRNGRFVYFVLAPTGFFADEATREFFYQLDNNGHAIEDVLRTTNRTTYHIQHIRSAPRWYYWFHS